MKTSELTGAALDWAVAKCVGFPVRDGFDDNCPEYSTDWAQGGPIIEREGIEICPIGNGEWRGQLDVAGDLLRFYGTTPLIAAMRCYVASKMGDEIEIPTELTKGESK